MLDDATIKDIEQDIQAIDPNANERRYYQRERRRKYMYEYNKRRYPLNRDKLRQQALDRYDPLIQSPNEHDPIDYSLL
jgi:hypothetical protein